MRWGNRDNSEIMSFFLNENMLQPLIRTVWQNGSNEGSQHMFLWRNIKSYPLIIPVTPYLTEHWSLYVDLFRVPMLYLGH